MFLAFVSHVTSHDSLHLALLDIFVPAKATKAADPVSPRS